MILWTSSPRGDSSFPLIRPRMVVSSAYLMMMLPSCVDVQSCVYSEESFGLRLQPSGVPVLSVCSAFLSHPHHLWAVCKEIQYPITGGSCNSQVCQRANQFHWSHCIKGRAVTQEQYPCICVLTVQVLQSVVKFSTDTVCTA